MKKLVWIVGATLVLYSAATKMQAQSQSSADRTGFQLQDECRFAAPNRPTDQPLSNEDAMKAVHCQGYILGIADMFMVWGARNDTLHAPSYLRPYACIPDDVTTGELIQVVLKYLNDNPTALHNEERWVATQALMGAYPCQP